MKRYKLIERIIPPHFRLIYMVVSAQAFMLWVSQHYISIVHRSINNSGVKGTSTLCTLSCKT